MKKDFLQYDINIDAIEQYNECASPMANCIVNIENGTRSILSFTKCVRFALFSTCTRFLPTKSTNPHLRTNAGT